MECLAADEAAALNPLRARSKREHGVPPKAGEVARIGSFPITNSM